MDNRDSKMVALNLIHNHPGLGTIFTQIYPSNRWNSAAGGAGRVLSSTYGYREAKFCRGHWYVHHEN